MQDKAPSNNPQLFSLNSLPVVQYMGSTSAKDKAGGHLGDESGLFAKLCRTVTLAFDNGGNGAIIGIDDFGLIQLFALGQAARLALDTFIVLGGLLQVLLEPGALPVGQGTIFIEVQHRFKRHRSDELADG